MPAYMRYIALAIVAMMSAATAQATDSRAPCTEDVMVDFDASGSMAGNLVQGIFSDRTRIGEVREALAAVLPKAAKLRNIGLITYGPGPYAQCNVQLNFSPLPDASHRILNAVEAIVPAGKTPIVKAVQQAIDVLDYKNKPGVVVLLTDGEETCGGAPCDLGKKIKTEGDITIHVVGYQLTGYRWTGAQSYLEVKCLSEETGGLYITTRNRQDLIDAFEKTLTCPIVSAIDANQTVPISKMSNDRSKID